MSDVIVESLSNPQYTNAEGNSIYCIVKFAHLSESVPFAATSYDPESYGVQIYNDCVAGVYGPIAPYVPPVIPVVEAGG